MKDEHGRLIAAPLICGAPCCALHGHPFCSQPAHPEGQILIIFLDLESTGVDPTFDRIVEFAALAAVGPDYTTGACFSTVVRVDNDFLSERGAAAASVHGIPPEELALGPSFSCVWRRFVDFVEHLVNSTLQSSSGSDDDEDARPDLTLPRIADDSPSVILAAHNGLRFDFCMMLFECVRNGLGMTQLMQWLFIDTLAIVNSMPSSFHKGCMKLQCLARQDIVTHQTRAHRALDDCVVLKAVMEDAAALLGLSMSDLFKQFTRQLDVTTTAVYIAAAGIS